METYSVDVASILELLGGTIEIDDTFELPHLNVGDEHFVMREPVRFHVTLTNGGTGIVGMGTVVAQTTATCARCLVEFPLTIEAQVDGYYAEPDNRENIPEEQEVGNLSPQGHVDILPAIMSALILEAPFAPLHAEDCAGICPQCGADRNGERCGCDADFDSDNPFAALGQLLGNEPADAE